MPKKLVLFSNKTKTIHHSFEVIRQNRQSERHLIAESKSTGPNKSILQEFIKNFERTYYNNNLT
jgi:hypothetical protein